jgi:hypothetical protein
LSIQYATDAPGIFPPRINASISIRQLKPTCVVEMINWAVAVVNGNLHQKTSVPYGRLFPNFVPRYLGIRLLSD